MDLPAGAIHIRFTSNPSKCHAPSLVGAIEGSTKWILTLLESLSFRGRTLARSGPASRPTGVAEEEGTIRDQIKTRRVTVEWVRNERVCDFGHAVRLYIDLRSTGGTERSGEKEEKKRRHGRMRERKKEIEKGKGKRDREDSIYSTFVSLSSQSREPFDSPRFESRSLPPSERQAKERRRKRRRVWKKRRRDNVKKR